MKSIRYSLMSVALFSTLLFSATSYDVTMEKKVNYNSWGAAWDTVVAMKNNIITVAAVPKLGGRVMQFDLGTLASIFINPNMKNKTITTGDSLVGGFRQLPSPQSDFPNTWPPPPTLDWGPYKCTTKLSTDSCMVYMESGVEDSSRYTKHKGLQYKRTLTIYKASSRMRVEMVMLNKGTSTLSHGIWDITEVIAENQNTWIYFPLNPQSTLGGGKKYVQYTGTDATQWSKDVVPGIMGVQYKKVDAQKIGADSREGWICDVNKSSGCALVKTFKYEEGKTYPDSGASVQVYTFGNTGVLEVEVLGPLASLAPNDSVSLVENWYAARSKGPIYSVNSAGLITKPLDTAQTKPDTVVVEGSYGVFYPGKVRAILKKADGTEIAAADSYAVSPSDYFDLKDTLKVPAGAAKIVLSLYTADGKFVGNLDSSGVQSPTSGIAFDAPAARSVYGSALTIVKKANTLYIRVSFRGSYRMDLTSLDGKRLLSRMGQRPATYSVPLFQIPAGVICVRLHHEGKVEAKRVAVR